MRQVGLAQRNAYLARISDLNPGRVIDRLKEDISALTKQNMGVVK